MELNISRVCVPSQGLQNVAIFLTIYHYVLGFRETAIKIEKQLFPKDVSSICLSSEYGAC